MSLLEWFRKGRAPKEDPRLQHWKDAWTRATAAPEADSVEPLASRLAGLGLPEDEIEIEREMLDGLERLSTLTRTAGAGTLPVLKTGHRVVGAELCHFSAPGSMPDEPNQPAGTLLLTSGRAIFVGGATARTMAWHSVGEILQSDRDVMLIRAARDHLYRIRTNTFGDALCAAYLARRLMGARRRVL